MSRPKRRLVSTCVDLGRGAGGWCTASACRILSGSQQPWRLATNPPSRIFGWTSYGAIALAAGLLAWAYPGMGWLIAWMIPANVVTFLMFCLDKVLARGQRMRVPEWVLLALALTGGISGALLGMAVARHKTSKRSFRVKLGVLLVIEAAVLAMWLFGAFESFGLASPWSASEA